MSETNCVVLGGGLVGGFIARRLAALELGPVVLVDRDPLVLEQVAADARLETMQADLSDPLAVQRAVQPAGLVLGAVPGWLGCQTAQAVLQAGKNLVDISFFPEDPAPLNELAQRQGVVAITDCGVMPGLGGMLGHALAGRLDEPAELTIMVGGLPTERRWPLQYKAPFSPADVIEEYLRPARLKEHGEVVEYPALSGVELVDFPGIGTLEAFNTDGLRTLLHTLPLPTMREKTLRYPGTAEQMRFLRELGFLDDAPRNIDGALVTPRALTSALLRDAWRLQPGDQEFTVMRVEVRGRHAGQVRMLRAELLDYTDAAGQWSMARTTGWPAVITAKLLAAGQLAPFAPVLTGQPAGAPLSGWVPSELLGRDPALFRLLEAGLADCGIDVSYSEQPA